MHSLQTYLNETLIRLRSAETDLQDIEVKDASGGVPGALADVISAFATGSGGTLILGLSEQKGFTPTGINASVLADAVASICANDLQPPVRPEMDVCTVDEEQVIVVIVDEFTTDLKPCFVKTKGLERGVFVRTHDGLRAMTTYEIHLLIASRGQPKDDRAPVPDTNVTDLEPKLVEAFTQRLRQTRGPNFQNSSNEEILDMMGVTTSCDGNTCLTLAGLLALGAYPQRYFPQLDITFVVLPTVTGEPMEDGTRFLDNQSIDGSIPAMVSIALTAMRRNMKRRSIVAGGGRIDQWEYPQGAIRELVVNALMHRDYHPLAHGTQVRIMLYPDRLEILSPGGLHGPIAKDSLMVEPVSAISRNATLTKILEDVQNLDDRYVVAENRGSGLLATAALLRRTGMSPPELTDTINQFTVSISNHGLLDEAAIQWLAKINTRSLNDRQRLGLAFLHQKGRLTNRQYRTINGCDAQSATRELSALYALGLLMKRGDRRGTVWTLAEELATTQATSRSPDGQEDLFENNKGNQRQRKDRREDICALLEDKPLSTSDISTHIGIGKQGTLRWLRRLEAENTIERTESSLASRSNRWKLTRSSEGRD